MSKIFKLIASIFLVAAFCLTFTANTTSAADNSKTKQDKKAMETFRKSVLATVNDNNQIFHQFFIFLMPDIQGELEFNGKITGHSLDMAGNFGLWMTGEDGKVIDTELPFYISQNDKDMRIYYKGDEGWHSYITPSVAATLTDAITSPTRAELDKQLSMVKEVKVLQENDSRRTLLVRLDGAKIADEMKLQANDNPADKGTAKDAEFQNKFLGYIDTGLRNSDLWYTWKIDKKNNRTGAISFDLSPIIQETARAALNDPANDDLPDEIKEILETFAFYSELRAYTSFLGPEAQTSLIIPQEVIDSAKPVEDLGDGKKVEEK